MSVAKFSQKESPNTVLDMSLATKIASGNERDVYISASLPGKVIKIPSLRINSKTKNRPVKRKIKNISNSFFPRYQWTRFVKREIEETTKCLKVKDSIKGAPPISLYLGNINTNFGKGYIYQMVANKEGQLGLKFGQAELKYGDEYCLELLNRLVEEIFAWNIILPDFNRENIVLDESGNTPRFVLVDGFGSYFFLSISSFSRKFNERQLRHIFASSKKRFIYNWNNDLCQYENP